MNHRQTHTDTHRHGQKRGRGLSGGQNGSILVYTLLSLIVFSMVLSVVYDQLIGIMKSSRDWLWKEKALVAAESAAAAAEGRLLVDPAWSAGEEGGSEWQFTLDDASAQIRTERFRMPDVIWIFAGGRYKREEKNMVRPIIVRDATLFAVMARNDLNVGFGSIVQGSVYGDSISIADGGEVVGGIISTGEIEIAHRPRETVLFDSATTPPLVPWIKSDQYTAQWPRPWSEHHPGDTAPGRRFYVQAGDLTLQDFAESNVSIRVGGNLTLNGKINMRFDPADDTPILFVEKNLTGTLSGARIRGVIYVNGSVSLKGEGLITGTLIARDVALGQGVVVQSFDAVPTDPRPPASFWPRRIQRIRN